MAALEDDYKTILVVAMAAADHFMSSLIAASNILRWKTEEEIKEFRHSMDDNFIKIGRDAGLRGLPEEVMMRKQVTQAHVNAGTGNAGTGNAGGNK